LLKIRLSRTGKKSQPSFRVIVQEHAKAVKGGKVVEIVGHYRPSTPNKDLVIKKDRIEHWISVGAQPTDTVASLLKSKEGFNNMDRYIGRRDVKAKKKKATEEAPAAAPAPAAEVKAEVPAEQQVTEEAQAQAPAKEEPVETPAVEEPKEEKTEESS